MFVWICKYGLLSPILSDIIAWLMQGHNLYAKSDGKFVRRPIACFVLHYLHRVFIVRLGTDRWSLFSLKGMEQSEWVWNFGALRQ